ncbi:peptidoglycan DD-metalloendopeptidase family protein [Halomonas salinarum]|uniref:peptidoglycan DD-metalloendopeptidase family protein n=1 Tax=Halomonas salinarum TaxID=1158993 RepID=UPI0014387E56|nr:peptidoglycan DD-metalloendopeptidase family protein [Halomonas salinarum]
MRKAMLASVVTLSLAACAAQPPGGASGIQVQDLSSARGEATSGSYTVEPGDTLYGIAWRYEMDFRDLAQLNGITPPYRIQPGQQLRLASGQGGERQGGAIANAEASGGQSQTSADRSSASGGGESPGWLEPNTAAIERNRRLTSAPLPDGSGEQADDSSNATATSSDQTPDPGALQGAATVAGGEQAPGPVYNYESPGADGELSAADRAEREAREKAEAAEHQQQQQQSTTQTASASTPTSSAEQSKTASQPSKTESQRADAGTSVAGEGDSTSERRTYQPVDEVPWEWPAEGDVISGFGEGSSITAGIDIGGRKGQSVRAAGPGVVVYAGDGVRGYGNLILLKHNNQFLSAYAHNDSLQVQENDVVEAGEVIATMGDTDADAVKLHFEVRKDGQPQDPLTFLPKR